MSEDRRQFHPDDPVRRAKDVMTAAQVQELRDSGQLIKSQDSTGFFLGLKPSRCTQLQSSVSVIFPKKWTG